MGTTYFIIICCYVKTSDTIKIADYISILAIIINFILAIIIVRTIQNRLTNKRVLKDHFISEIKELRNEYRDCINKLHSNSANSKEILPLLKLMNIKAKDLIELVNIKHGIDKQILLPYQDTLRELITNNVDFIRDFNTVGTINFSEDSKNSFHKFQQENNHIFNDLIIKINDAG